MLKSTRVRMVNFAAGGSLYQLQDGVAATDIKDQLNARLGHLFAMLTITHGAGAESFNDWSDEIKDDYMWSAAMIAEECKELAEHL